MRCKRKNTKNKIKRHEDKNTKKITDTKKREK